MPKLFDAMMELMAANDSSASDDSAAPPSRAHLLTRDQIKILLALGQAAAASPDASHRSLAALSAATGLRKTALRIGVRALAHHGLAQYKRGARLHSGYAITRLGRLHLDMLTSRAKP